MVNFSILSHGASEFLAPRQLLHGPGSSGTVGAALHNWGVSPGEVVVVADQVVAERGLLDHLLSGLAAGGFSCRVFAGVAGEPDDAVVGHAVEIARRWNPVTVIGIGGGSAMDTAKLAALLARNTGGIQDWLGVVAPPEPVIPLALVPTTTGTGSEATRIAMLTVGGAKRIVSCAQFLPVVAVLDPELVADLPSSVVASTGMDALAHAIESTLSKNRTFLTLTLGAQAIKILLDQVEAGVVARDRQARGRLLYGAYLAGLALNAGVVVGHSLGYVIARHARLPHGTACALATSYCLAYNQTIEEPVAHHIARAVTRGTTSDLRSAALAVDELCRRLELPDSLADVSVQPAELDAMATETVREYPRPNNPEPLEEGRLRLLLEYMYAGDVAGAWAAMGEPTAK